MKCTISWPFRRLTALICALSSFSAQVLNAEALEPSAFGILADYDVVIVGELHDNRAHHDNQAAIVSRIAPKALVFEMLSPSQAAGAADISRTDKDALEAALNWSDTSWPDFGMYFPIFEAAPGAKIYGAAVPFETVRASIENGAATEFAGDAGLYGLSQPLVAAERKRREDLQSEAHCNALPAEMLPGMVEAQRLRDASFALTTLQALEKTGGPVVVITGHGHARKDWGIPRFLKRAAPEVKTAAVGQILQPADAPPYDFWIVTGDYTPQDGDPCTAFK